MKRVGDISAWQTHDADDWSIRRPYDLGVYAGAVDACWVRWTDWHGFVKWGADPDYALCIDTLRGLGAPVGPYLYPAPGLASPGEQIRAWHRATPAITFDPMLDPENPDGLSGPAFSQWVDQALDQMAQLWQRTPWLYAQDSKVREWGWTRPNTPHRLILAGYPYGYQPFPWADRASWEQRAYAKYGGPDIPWGLGGTDAWQFTSSAEVPGMPGLTDHSFMTDQAFAASAGAGDDGFTPEAERQLFDVWASWVGPRG